MLLVPQLSYNANECNHQISSKPAICSQLLQITKPYLRQVNVRVKTRSHVSTNQASMVTMSKVHGCWHRFLKLCEQCLVPYSVGPLEMSTVKSQYKNYFQCTLSKHISNEQVGLPFFFHDQLGICRPKIMHKKHSLTPLLYRLKVQQNTIIGALYMQYTLTSLEQENCFHMQKSTVSTPTRFVNVLICTCRTRFL